MAALKGLVIFMAVLIFLGLAVVFLGIAGVIGGPGDDTALGAVSLGLPAGCRIADVVAAEARLIVRTEGVAAACGAVFVVDLVSGEILGTVAP